MMLLYLTKSDWTALFPKAPKAIVEAFTSTPEPIAAAGITSSRTRLAYTLANLEHECGGFTVKNLTENINYSAKRMAEVWPNRFSSASAVEARFGTKSGWQKAAFDEIYGKRMGNRPGTDDGSRYIGRGGPQITGRDGYRSVGDLCNLDLEGDPELATLPENQPAILGAFFVWKKLAKHADKGDFKSFVKAWNGGTNGMADRIEQMKGNDPIIAKLTQVAAAMPVLDALVAHQPENGQGVPVTASAALAVGHTDSDFATRLVQICEAECDFFGDGEKKEFEESVFQRVGDYWTEVAKTKPYGSWAGYNGKSGVKFNTSGKVTSNKNQPWSAAFISFVMSKAGAGSDFSYAPSHSVYLVKALDAAKKTNPSEKFVAQRHKRYVPKPGDLIACERKPTIDPNFDTYKAFVAAGHYEAHCDVVTEVHDKFVITIGGNVGNSVTRKKWPLDSNMTIGNHDPKSSTSGVICIVENRL